MDDLEDFVMRQLVAWRNEKPADIFGELHEEVIINQDFSKNSNADCWEIWDTEEFRLADWVVDMCIFQGDIFLSDGYTAAEDYDTGFLYQLSMRQGRKIRYHGTYEKMMAADPTTDAKQYK